MKYLITSLVLLLCLNLYAQEEIPQKKIFLRVYNLNGKKIHKGKVVSISDSILKLNSQNKIIQISLEEIGIVKTKRSVGHNTLMGASIGLASGIILSETDATSGGESFYEGYSGLGTGLLTTGGSLIGAFSGLVKDIKKFEINGDLENFKKFKRVIIDRK